MHQKQQNAEKGKEVLNFFNWAYDKGNQEAKNLDYAVLPAEVVEQIRAAWKTSIKDSNGKPIY